MRQRIPFVDPRLAHESAVCPVAILARDCRGKHSLPLCRASLQRCRNELGPASAPSSLRASRMLLDGPKGTIGCGRGTNTNVQGRPGAPLDVCVGSPSTSNGAFGPVQKHAAGAQAAWRAGWAQLVSASLKRSAAEGEGVFSSTVSSQNCYGTNSAFMCQAWVHEGDALTQLAVFLPDR